MTYSLLQKHSATLFSPYRLVLFVALSCLLLSACSEKTRKEETSRQTWAEKLGYGGGKKVLLLHMDDIGMCPEANEAAIRYIENKHIMSGAVMMPCPNADEFIEWAKNHPEADIGLHLTLTSEWKTYRWASVTDPAKVPGLIDSEGRMWRKVPDVVVHASPAEVETEIRAQIEKCLALGYRPHHLDTHMGTLYGSPQYVKVFFKVAEEYNIPANVIDLSDHAVVMQFRKQGYPITDEVVQLANNYKLAKLDNFTSVQSGKTYEEKRTKFLDLVSNLKPGLTEIIFHPSVETDNLRTITNSWQQRVWEADLFADPEVIDYFRKEGIIITTWREVTERFNTVAPNNAEATR